MMNIDKGQLIIISGPSGSGKSTALKELFNLAEYKFSISVAARKPRNGETDGIDYNFISKEEFENKIANGEMLEYVEYSGNYYGTLKEPVEKMLSENYDVILDIEVEGALNIKKIFPDAILIFLPPPSYSELERRLKGRGTETEESINKRLERGKKEISCIGKYDYFVINEVDMYKKAAFDIHCIVKAEKNKINQEKAKQFLKDYFS